MRVGRGANLAGEEQLGRPVPQRHDDGRVVLERRAVLTRQAEVADLQQTTD